MVITLPAIYEQGILRPLEPLTLPESSRVQVQILNDDASAKEASYQRCLADLRRLLSLVEQSESNPLVQQVFVQRIEPDLRRLWRLASPSRRELCGMLVLAATQVRSESLTPEQVSAFVFGLLLLESGKLTEADLDACEDRLTLAGLPPSISLSEAVVQSYIDEL